MDPDDTVLVAGLNLQSLSSGVFSARLEVLSVLCVLQCFCHF